MINNGRAVCDSHHVNEDVKERTYLAAIRSMAEDADDIIVAIRESAELALEPENAAALGCGTAGNHRHTGSGTGTA